MLTAIRKYAAMILWPRGQTALINRLPKNSVLIDVGCGARSPRSVKTKRPDCYYIGIDVTDCKQRDIADEYILCKPEEFTRTIASIPVKADAVLCSHNIEHCVDPVGTINAMCSLLKEGGVLYMSFPCEASTSFPSRQGGLNFRDDPTHNTVPVFASIMMAIEANGLRHEYATRRYRPPILFLAGALLEPISLLLRRNMPFGSTWAFWGFETVIWARKVTAPLVSLKTTDATPTQAAHPRSA